MELTQLFCVHVENVCITLDLRNTGRYIDVVQNPFERVEHRSSLGVLITVSRDDDVGRRIFRKNFLDKILSLLSLDHEHADR